MPIPPNQQNFEAHIQNAFGVQTGFAVHAGSATNSPNNSTQLQILEAALVQPYIDLGVQVDLGAKQNGHNLRNRVLNGSNPKV